jgi:FkbM family methyltransferase
MTRRNLVTTFEDLYGRLQTGELTDEDLIDVGELRWPDMADFVARLYADSALFDAHFGSFKDSYDIFRIFAKDDTVLDVGADWGYSAIAMRHQGCRSRIVSIEAMPFNIPPLARLKCITGSNYDFVHMAAGERAERLRFYLPILNGSALTGLSSTGGTLTAEFATLPSSRAQWFPPEQQGGDDEARIAHLDVNSAPLDAILERLGTTGQRVVAVKMDVEGHEAAALKGAERLFRVQKPLLMLEGGDRSPGVAEVMASYEYFLAARANGCLVPDDGHSPTDDGFWLHKDRLNFYRDAGIFEGALVG